MTKRKNNNLKNFKPQTMTMKKNHTWKAPDGYKIVVADRGAVSFNVPSEWLLVKMEPLELNDAEPPNDEARISMSFWRMPPGMDWSGLPLGELLEKSTEGSDMEVLERSELHTVERKDIELVWMQHRFMDPVEHREAYSRFMMGRGFDVHVLITCDFWVEDAPRLIPIWNEVVRSLQLGREIEDPTKGPVLH